MPGIRAISSSATQQLLNSVLPSRGQKAFQLALPEICLIAPLMTGFLYQLGKNREEGGIPLGKRLFTSLGEAGLTQFLIENTGRVYPFLGLGWAAYEAGSLQTVDEKIRAALKAGVTFFLAYVAINLGLGITDGLRRRDAREILDSLRPLHPLMDQSALKSQSVVRRSLQPLLKNLQDCSQKFIDAFGSSSKKTGQQIKPLAAALTEAQDALVAKISSFTPRQLQKAALGKSAEGALHALSKGIRSTRGYRVIRALNPLFAYVLAVSLVGPIALKFLQDALFSSSAKKAPLNFDNTMPLWLDAVIGTRASNPGLNEHTHPFLRADGPALLNRAWEGNLEN